MSDSPVLVVGAGPAGLTAATELARAGVSVLVVDQAPTLGGAVFRQPMPGVESIAVGAPKKRWQTVMTAFNAQKGRITISTSTKFGGLDHTGTVFLSGEKTCLLRPRALVLALGARESVQPRPGWTLAGVETVGSLQIRMKIEGKPPEGRVLLAGSGPLLLALAAEMTRLGNPPVAVIEAASPFAHPLQSLCLPPGYLAEACRYLSRLWRSGVPVLTGAHVSQICVQDGALQISVDSRRGPRQFTADRVGLHDGIRSNDIGLPPCAMLPVIRVGDCREALGAQAAVADGRGQGRALAAKLLGRPEPAEDPEIGRQRAAQTRLARIYASDSLARLSDLPGDTVLCRCEGRTVDDLRALGPAPRARQLRLDGRFAMGPCQGRFCADWVARMIDPQAVSSGIGAPRWPARPIAVADILAATDQTSGDDR
ncbi:MAG: FAD/NAD(P)-binding oxidoreductase [Pseudotabrizicola sp.]|uniref:NAD(P)/FAD-dependent oxidoreductase n=1 Tax=Pseudotabrizicola sp. TaxID=2939647 RepID=UPI002726AA8F|nr:FAD/NAD(P)-binding oxidoreductase [Pseudotabrizicola sp.]MDO9637982.1 FAD/NAD(P)-binding oxidoreductase [Pseudotabrizicola sp.]